MISPRYPRGLGSLAIDNGTESDAVAKLKDAAGQRTLAAIYIRAGASVSMTNIGVGTYVLQFMHGRECMSPVKGVNRIVWLSSSSLWACVITR
jgi:hypothetical protein